MPLSTAAPVERGDELDELSLYDRDIEALFETVKNERARPRAKRRRIIVVVS